MATPVADYYTKPESGALYAGRVNPSSLPAWATGLPTNTWVQLSSMQRFYDFGIADPLIGAVGYRGTNSINSIVNAYCDPAYDIASGEAYYYGGGHGDGTCNALVKSNLDTLAWTRAVDPTPPSVYLPDYIVGAAPYDYPSGVRFSPRAFQLASYFLTEAEGLDPVLDADYIAPKLARGSTHMYAAAVFRPATRTCHYFYNGYGEVNVDTGNWFGHDVNLEAQIKSYQNNLGTTDNVWGVSAVFDAVTDRAYFLVTGGGYRNHIAQFNCDTRLIESIYSCPVPFKNASPLTVVGRKLYIMSNQGTYPGFTQPHGAIFDFDTKSFKKFVTTGVTMPSIQSSMLAETIPLWYDEAAGVIRRWNYTRDLSKIYTMSLVPASGTGTDLDPYLLDQTEQTISIDASAFATSAGIPVAYVYSRIFYHRATGVAMLIPRSDASTHNTGKYVALKLS